MNMQSKLLEPGESLPDLPSVCSLIYERSAKSLDQIATAVVLQLKPIPKANRVSFLDDLLALFDVYTNPSKQEHPRQKTMIQ